MPSTVVLGVFERTRITALLHSTVDAAHSRAGGDTKHVVQRRVNLGTDSQ